MLLSVPYSKDWTAYVDGKEVKIHRANTAFSGLALTKGNHKIRLVYSTSGFTLGLALSVVGVLAFIALMIARYVRKKKRHT